MDREVDASGKRGVFLSTSIVTYGIQKTTIWIKTVKYTFIKI